MGVERVSQNKKNTIGVITTLFGSDMQQIRRRLGIPQIQLRKLITLPSIAGTEMGTGEERERKARRMR